MPLPFDLSQVFWGLMNKTMWDCRLGNMNGFGGFNGGFMNSCWGGGFQMPTWGDSYDFTSTSKGSSSTNTVEDEVDKRQLTRKQNTLYKLLEDYAKSLPEGKDRDTIEVTLNRYKTVKQENYEALQALYEENKTKIQKKFDNGSKIEASNESKAAANDFARTNPDFKTILKVDGDNKTTAQLKDGVDAMGFLYSLQTAKKKSFKALYNDAFKNADETKKAEMKKVLQAVYNGLTAAANQVKADNNVSDETKASINKLLEISDTNAAPENVDQLYYWIRIARAEIADNKYACLHEDFANDPLLGKANGVESTTAALKAEGIDVENIKKQTIITDFSNKTGEQKMKSLEEGNYITPLTADQLNTLNNIDGVPKGIKKAWVDNDSVYNYQIIRYIDKNGDIKYVMGVGLKDNQIKKIGGQVKAGPSASPEDIQKRAATLAAVKAATDTLTEVRTPIKDDNRRVFEEKNVTGNRNYKRLFVINNSGELQEWTNTKVLNGRFVKVKKEEPNGYNSITLNDISQSVTVNNNQDVNKASAKYSPKVTAVGTNLINALNGDTRYEIGNIVKSEINKDNIVDVIYQCKQNNINIVSEIAYKRNSLGAGTYTQGFISRIPKALLRKAYELGLQNTKEYKALADYYGATGKPSYTNKGAIASDDSFTFTKSCYDNLILNARDAIEVDKMIIDLYNRIVNQSSS